jgi:CBS domain-containing protein
MKCVSEFMIRVPVLKSDELLTKARSMLRDDVFRELYVQNGKRKLLGYIDITDVLRVKATKSNVTVEGYVKEAATVGQEDTIEAAMRQIRDHRTDSSAVIDGDSRIIGGVLLSDLFPIIISKHELRGKVAEYMSGSVVTCTTEDTVQRILSLIVESGFSAFPVLKKGKLIGILSRRDLLRERRLKTSPESPSTMTVEGVMTKTVVTIDPGEEVSRAAELMVKHDISRLPVVKDGRLTGIIDRHDVLKGL